MYYPTVSKPGGWYQNLKYSQSLWNAVKIKYSANPFIFHLVKVRFDNFFFLGVYTWSMLPHQPQVLSCTPTELCSQGELWVQLYYNRYSQRWAKAENSAGSPFFTGNLLHIDL